MNWSSYMERPGPTDRAYHGLKTAILRGEFRHSDTIRTQWLTGRFDTSLTPLREAVRRLEGEGLLSLDRRSGFHALSQDEFALSARYTLNQDILLLALWKVRNMDLIRATITIPADDADPGGLADAVGALFLEIAKAAPSNEYASMVRRMNDRLHAARLAEAAVMDEPVADVRNLMEIAMHGSKLDLRDHFRMYHRVRIKLARKLSEKIHGFARVHSPM